MLYLYRFPRGLMTLPSEGDGMETEDPMEVR
jgi:hypothetical protein